MHLSLPLDSGALHPASKIHSVSPDIILRLLSSNHPGHHRTMTDAYAKLEVVPWFVVDSIHFLSQGKREFYQNFQMFPILYLHCTLILLLPCIKHKYCSGYFRMVEIFVFFVSVEHLKLWNFSTHYIWYAEWNLWNEIRPSDQHTETQALYQLVCIATGQH